MVHTFLFLCWVFRICVHRHKIHLHQWKYRRDPCTECTCWCFGRFAHNLGVLWFLNYLKDITLIGGCRSLMLVGGGELEPVDEEDDEESQDQSFGSKIGHHTKK